MMGRARQIQGLILVELLTGASPEILHGRPATPAPPLPPPTGTVFGVGVDWDNPIPRTRGPNQTMVHECTPPVGDRYNLTICEIRAPLAPETTPPSVSMTAPANGAILSGSSVAVSSLSDRATASVLQPFIDQSSCAAHLPESFVQHAATNGIFVSQAYGDNEYPVIHVLAVQMP